MRHRIDAGFLLFHPNSSRFYRLAKIGMNRGESWPESEMSDWGSSIVLLRLISVSHQVSLGKQTHWAHIVTGCDKSGR